MKAFIWLIIFGLLGLIIGWLSSSSELAALSPINLTSSSCQLSDSQNDKTHLFTVEAGSELSAQALLNSLCHSDVLKKNYTGIRAQWSASNDVIASAIQRGNVDLVFSKSRIIEHSAATKIHGYLSVASLDTYDAFFIAKNSPPELKASYFFDKKIGLLKSPDSRSGHLLPKIALASLGLDINSLNITYAPSHSALRHLIKAGTVDVIGSYWSESDKSWTESAYKIAVQENVEGNQWYLKAKENNTPLLCEIEKALTQLSEKNNSPYFGSMRIRKSCKKVSV